MAIKLDPKVLAHLQSLAAKMKAEGKQAVKEKLQQEPEQIKPTLISPQLQSTISQILTPSLSAYSVTDRYGNPIDLNSAQDEAVRAAVSGSNLVVTGAAGTGKTTCMNGVVSALDQVLPPVDHLAHKYFDSKGIAGLVFCAFTHVACRNLRNSLPQRYRHACVTIHKLLAFEPVYEDVMQDNGEFRTKMSFEPQYNRENPLPSEIHTIVIEEASMVPLDLWEQLMAAIHHKVQFIFLGDLNQLPPAFGQAVMGYKLLEWKVVELTEVYRQALDSPILKLAHHILSGVPITASGIQQWKELDSTKLRIYPAQVSNSEDSAVQAFISAFKRKYSMGRYNPAEDIILIPYNVNVGQIALNKGIAEFLARNRNAPTYEIRTGFENVYLSPGDRVLHGPDFGTVIEIQTNYAYTGEQPRPASYSMNYYGIDATDAKHLESSFDEEQALAAVDEILAQSDEVQRKRSASHKVKIALDDGREITLASAGDLNNLLLAYAITIYKAQGSEWRRVFCCFHKSHKSLCREALYTAVTRAREELVIFCEKDTFIGGITKQKIKGKTLAEKAIYFQGKVS